MKKLFTVLLIACLLGACAGPAPEPGPSPTPVPTAAPAPTEEPSPSPTAEPRKEYVLVSLSYGEDGQTLGGMLYSRAGLTSFSAEADMVHLAEGLDQLEVGQILDVRAEGIRMTFPGQLTGVSEVSVLGVAEDALLEQAMQAYDSWHSQSREAGEASASA